MTDLAKKECVPCKVGSPPISEEKIREYMPSLHPDWEVEGQKKLERVFRFGNFREALAFANQVGAIAEKEQHHPMLTISWGRVKVTLRTMKIKALHDNDFILAAKIDEIEP